MNGVYVSILLHWQITEAGSARQRQLGVKLDVGSDGGAHRLSDSSLSEYTILESDLHKMTARYPEPLHSRTSVPERASKIAKRRAIEANTGTGIVFI